MPREPASSSFWSIVGCWDARSLSYVHFAYVIAEPRPGESATRPRLIYFYRSYLASCPGVNVAPDGRRFDEGISAGFRHPALRYGVTQQIECRRSKVEEISWKRECVEYEGDRARIAW